MSAKAGWGTNIGLAQAAVDAHRVGTDPSLLLGGFRDDDKAPGRHSMRYQLIGEIPGSPAAPAGAGECRGVRSNRPSPQVKTATVRSAIGRGKQGDFPWIDGQTDELQSSCIEPGNGRSRRERGKRDRCWSFGGGAGFMIEEQLAPCQQPDGNGYGYTGCDCINQPPGSLFRTWKRYFRRYFSHFAYRCLEPGQRCVGACEIAINGKPCSNCRTILRRQFAIDQRVEQQKIFIVQLSTHGSTSMA